MYSYQIGDQWIEGVSAKDIIALAKNGTILRNTPVRIPDGRIVKASDFKGIEFGGDFFESIPDTNTPIIPMPPDTTSSHVYRFHPRNYAEINRGTKMLRFFFRWCLFFDIFFFGISIVAGIMTLVFEGPATGAGMFIIVAILFIGMGIFTYIFYIMLIGLIELMTHIAHDVHKISFLLDRE